MQPRHLVRALRLPFLSASLFPYAFGSFLAGRGFRLGLFVLGAVAVAGTHLSANVLNDYADAKSGVDDQDDRYFGFFGGSKLIQAGVLPAAFYGVAALVLAGIALAAVGALAVLKNDADVVAWYALILLLGWAYSAEPLRLSYRCLGEVVVFLLFGPATVMGGYAIQTGVFPALRVFLLSLPFGFLTAAILLANEVPDASDDRAAGKRTLVGAVGAGRGYVLYAGASACAFASIVVCFALGHLGGPSALSVVGLAPAVVAASILRRRAGDKPGLVPASVLVLGVHSFVSVVLILDVCL
ncbi:MAG: prenyltransferase [Planctomycetota bacterium]